MNEANTDIVAQAQDKFRGVSAATASGVPAVFIGATPLLRTGFKHLLSGTRFVVSDRAYNDRSPLPGEALVLIVSGAGKTIRQVKAQYPQVRVCVLADNFDIRSVTEGCEAGADGFCLTTASRDVLIGTLELIMLGERIVPSSVARSVLERASRGAEHQIRQKPSDEGSCASNLTSCKLSNREGEILRSLMIGSPNKVIARQFGVTEATVKVHVKAILRKIGAKNRTQAAMWAANHIPDAQGKGITIKSVS